MEGDKWLSLLGLGGGFVLSIMMLPQLWQVYKTNSAKDLSWGFLINYLIGLSMLFAYAVGKGLWSLYIPQSYELLIVSFQIYIKFRYDRRGKVEITPTTALESIITLEMSGTEHTRPSTSQADLQRRWSFEGYYEKDPREFQKTLDAGGDWSWAASNAYFQHRLGDLLRQDRLPVSKKGGTTRVGELPAMLMNVVPNSVTELIRSSDLCTTTKLS